MEPGWDADDLWSSEEVTLGSDSQIEVAGPDDIPDGEFDPSDIDATSIISKFGTIASSIYRHATIDIGMEHVGDLVFSIHLSYACRIVLPHCKDRLDPIPNDETEQNREEIKHIAFLEITRGKYYFAPIGDNPQKIIDLGTGMGTWAIEVADMFPSAQVVGCDLSPIQPFWVPSNVRFIIDDIGDDWAHGDNWDFVHARQVLPTIKDPARLCEQSFSHIKPGGWIETQDFGAVMKCDDGTLREDSMLIEFTTLVTQALAPRGINWIVGNDMEEILRNAGFVNIQYKKFKTPIGMWPKAKRLRLVGLYMKSAFADLIDALVPRLFPSLSKSPQQIKEFLAGVQSELLTTQAHIYLDYYFWYAQKPLAN
ncbi:S-adenosyl-L-methionine-dependent methyltransferase [Hypoxylon fragiforme]|uniref:S-adenosyl-L-methionine-dependent methyltransferase n=1 Tax=Hypoxylon fragiforme TaxID=63214 RepID=UPI0020C6720F|nr:S-adenosyl-L-methionine-dependent methyltransferase [Hypoxylon fragiforme]KAI2604088.1 S-adenosyl-L-methionine-dependent methyltransferase [Hypoxylon fragiforme]